MKGLHSLRMPRIVCSFFYTITPVYLLLTGTFSILTVPNGGSIIDDKDGIGESEYLYVEGQVTNTDGKPLQNVVVETWETDDEGSLLIMTISHFF